MNKLESDLRKAVTRLHFAEVRQLAAAFGAQAAAEWQGLPPGDPEAQRVFARFQSTFEWVRLMLSTSRASLAAQLVQVQLTNHYLNSGIARGSRVRSILA